MIAFIPEAQTLFIVEVITDKGNPALSTACRVGACPPFDEMTLPKIASSMEEAELNLATRALITCEAKEVALKEESDDLKEPIGDRKQSTTTIGSWEDKNEEIEKLFFDIKLLQINRFLIKWDIMIKKYWQDLKKVKAKKGGVKHYIIFLKEIKLNNNAIYRTLSIIK